MVAMSRTERMVAHDVADAPFLLAVVVRRGTLFEQNSSIMFFVMLLGTAPIDEFPAGSCLAPLVSDS